MWHKVNYLSDVNSYIDILIWSMIMLLKYTQNVMVCLFLSLNQNFSTNKRIHISLVISPADNFQGKLWFHLFQPCWNIFSIYTRFSPFKFVGLLQMREDTVWRYKSLNTKYKLREFRGCWGHANEIKRSSTWKLFLKPCQCDMVNSLILLL